MKKITLSILSFIAASQLLFAEALPASKDPAVQKKADKQIKMQNSEVVKSVVDELSKKVPQKVDKFTTFTKIANEGLTLIYTYEINAPAKSDDEIRAKDRTRMEYVPAQIQGIVLTRMEKAVVYGVCTRSKRFLESNISLTYLYVSAKSKEELFRFEFTPKTCAEVWASLKKK